MDKKKILSVAIWIDGSATPNPGAGGWAVVLLSGSHARVLAGYEDDTTNNRMEATALLMGLKCLKGQCMVTVCTDSQYVRQGLARLARGVMPDANPDLWGEIWIEYKRHVAIRVEQVLAHQPETHVLNRYCDCLSRRVGQGKEKPMDTRMVREEVYKQAQAAYE